MRILVTGAAGMIGRKLTGRIAADGGLGGRPVESATLADVVLGSRWVPGGTVLNWPRRRELLSRGGNLYIRLALGIDLRDATAGFRAYRRAAQTLASLSEPLRTIAHRGALETLPGIGKTLSREIQELLETGRLRYYEYLITTVPEGILALLRLHSLSTEQVRTLWRTHDITSMKQLAQAFYAERLPFEAAILGTLGQEIAAWERAQHRMLLGVALPRRAPRGRVDRIRG